MNSERFFLLLPYLGLRARYLSRSRTFISINESERDGVAFFQFVIGNANEFFGMKEEVLGLAFASNESKSFRGKSLDCSCHMIVLIILIFLSETSTFVSVPKHGY